MGTVFTDCLCSTQKNIRCLYSDSAGHIMPVCTFLDFDLGYGLRGHRFLIECLNAPTTTQSPHYLAMPKLLESPFAHMFINLILSSKHTHKYKLNFQGNSHYKNSHLFLNTLYYIIIHNTFKFSNILLILNLFALYYYGNYGNILFMLFCSK